HIFSAIKPLNNFLSIYEIDTIVGLGTVVVEEGWGCISNVVVDGKHRRKGIALEIIKNLTEWAYKNGAYCIYLQVVKENQ
ncbi:GNAT family N-acetyltransferase, partial [Streptomyces caeruleatus]